MEAEHKIQSAITYVSGLGSDLGNFLSWRFLMMSESDKDRVLAISQGLYHNEQLLALHKKGDPEPVWSKPKKESDHARQHQG